MQEDQPIPEHPAVDELIVSIEMLAPTPPWSEQLPFGLAMVDTAVHAAVTDTFRPTKSFVIGRTMLPGGMIIRYTLSFDSITNIIYDLDLHAITPQTTELRVESAANRLYYTMMSHLLPRIHARLDDIDPDRRRIVQRRSNRPARQPGRPPKTATRWLYEQLDGGRDPDDPTLFAEWHGHVEAARGRPLADPERSYRDLLNRKK